MTGLDLKSAAVGLGVGIALMVLANGTPLDFEGFGVKFTTHKSQLKAVQQEKAGALAALTAVAMGRDGGTP